jgi:hypothetical protein
MTYEYVPGQSDVLTDVCKLLQDIDRTLTDQNAILRDIVVRLDAPYPKGGSETGPSPSQSEDLPTIIHMIEAEVIRHEREYHTPPETLKMGYMPKKGAG